MIQIDLESAVPIEEQIVSEIRHAIAREEVKPGDALPSVRQLASDLQIHWNTVARAYRRLQSEDLVRVGRGRGVVVRARNSGKASPGSPRFALVTESIRRAVTEALLAGISADELGRMVAREVERVNHAQQGG